LRGDSLDQALREPEPSAQQALAARHLPVVGLVVITGQVQQPV
jgi:hypothetical protein